MAETKRINVREAMKFEEITGEAFADVMDKYRFDNDKKSKGKPGPPIKIIAALAYVTKLRDDPELEWEPFLDTEVEDLEAILDEAGGNPTQGSS